MYDAAKSSHSSPTRRNRLPGLIGVIAGLSCTGMIVFGSTAASAADPSPTPEPPAATAAPTPAAIEYRPGPGATSPPDLAAEAWIIADAKTGDVLAAREPHRRLPPASTLKTLTALTVMPWLEPNSTYLATSRDMNADGGRAGIVAGASYTVNDLLNGLMLPSGNDAASALANAFGGWQPTLQAMNAEADRLNAADTTAKNPSGLDAPGNLSSAFDLATIFRGAIENQQLRDLLQVKQTPFPGAMPKQGERESFLISSENRLLTDGYPGIIGGKTGYTSNAGRTFVAAAEQDGRTLVISFMRSTAATEKAAVRLLDWGFANADKVTPVGQLPAPDGPQPTPTRRAAVQLDTQGNLLPGQQQPPAAPPASTPTEPSTPELDDSTLANSTVASSATANSVEPDGPSLLAILAWTSLVVLAAVVGLRVRAVIRLRRRQARARLKAESRANVDVRSSVPDQPSVGSGTNPTRS